MISKVKLKKLIKMVVKILCMIIYQKFNIVINDKKFKRYKFR